MLNDRYQIWLSSPHLNGTEIEYIREAFDKNWISPYGENSDVFEKQLEDYFGVPDVALLNSGTSAIHLSLIVGGVEQGDTVIVPTLNFAGCINPILYQKAIPLFIDSEKDTWNMDPGLVEEVIKKQIAAGKKPKAIIAVDLFGIPCKINDLLALSAKYDIRLIEDAADAIGSRYQDRPLGVFGSMGIISFNGNKVITTSGGGALISQDSGLIAKAKHLSNQARKTIPHYIHDMVGYNYMMSNILAGIGRGQMEVLDERVKRRREIYDIYKTELADIESLYFPDDLPGSFSNRWLSVMLIDPENSKKLSPTALYNHLVENGIESRPVWNPMHLQPAYSQFPYFGGSVAESLFKSGLCLPSGSSMTAAQQQTVIAGIRQLFS
jgi:dTDP-4-amino-4,6-dideoxygalactose transaminase